MNQSEIDALKRSFIAEGYNPWVAEGLAENEITVEQAKTLWSVNELMDLVLTWHGIQGYTSNIIDAVDNLRNMEAV